MKPCRRVMGIVHLSVAVLSTVMYVRAFWQPVNDIVFIFLFCLLFVLHIPGTFLLNPPGRRRFFGTFGMNPRAPKYANRVNTSLLVFFGINFLFLILLVRPGSSIEQQRRYKTLARTNPSLSHQIDCAETRTFASCMVLMATAMGLTYWFYDYSGKPRRKELVSEA